MAVIVLIVICGLLMKVVSCDCPGVSIHPVENGTTYLTRNETICSDCHAQYNYNSDRRIDLFAIRTMTNWEERLIRLNISRTFSGGLETFVFSPELRATVDITRVDRCATFTLPILPQSLIGNGTASYNNFTEKFTVVQFSCNPGYTLEGNKIIAFIIGPDNLTYSWNGTAPYCQIHPMPSPPPNTAYSDVVLAVLVFLMGAVCGVVLGLFAVFAPVESCYKKTFQNHDKDNSSKKNGNNGLAEMLVETAIDMDTTNSGPSPVTGQQLDGTKSQTPEAGVRRRQRVAMDKLICKCCQASANCDVHESTWPSPLKAVTDKQLDGTKLPEAGVRRRQLVAMSLPMDKSKICPKCGRRQVHEREYQRNDGDSLH